MRAHVITCPLQNPFAKTTSDHLPPHKMRRAVLRHLLHRCPRVGRRDRVTRRWSSRRDRTRRWRYQRASWTCHFHQDQHPRSDGCIHGLPTRLGVGAFCALRGRPPRGWTDDSSALGGCSPTGSGTWAREGAGSGVYAAYEWCRYRGSISSDCA